MSAETIMICEVNNMFHRKVLCCIFLLTPNVVYSVNKDDLDVIKSLLKEHRVEVIKEAKEGILQNECYENVTKEVPTKVLEQISKSSSKDDVAFKDTPEYEPSIGAVNRHSKMAEYLYETDIMLTKAQAQAILASKKSRGRRQAGVVGVNLTLWDRNIPFVYDCNYPERDKRYIKYAMDVYEKSTCLKFFEGVKEEYILNFVYEDGCWSYMGRVEKRQELSLGDGCQTIGHSIHELGHALGFFHTHARHDRDEHIKVNFENIIEEYIGQFGKETKQNNNNMDIPYDYGSVMHYDQFDTQKNESLITMVANNEFYQWTMGGYYESFYDMMMINKLYSCNDCANSTIKCENGGYPNPNNCTECNCPRGFGGVLCNERPNDGCGKTFNASAEWQKFSDILGNGSKTMNYHECNYWIQAPANKILEIRLDDYQGGKCQGGCTIGGIEIKAQEDQRLTGYRFCCKEKEQMFITNHTIVPIFTFQRWHIHNATISYRFVDNGKTEVNLKEEAKPDEEEYCTCPKPIKLKLSNGTTDVSEKVETKSTEEEEICTCPKRIKPKL